MGGLGVAGGGAGSGEESLTLCLMVELNPERTLKNMLSMHLRVKV